MTKARLAQESRVADDRRKPLGSRVGRLLRRVGRRLGGAPDRPTPSGPVAVEFEGGASGMVAGGSSILSAARQLGIELDHYCGGLCSCGTCRVRIVRGAENLSRVQGNESMVLGAERTRAGDRLACQARLLGPVVVRVPDWF